LLSGLHVKTINPGKRSQYRDLISLKRGAAWRPLFTHTCTHIQSM
jgi:hypothetical protein